jgi:hypothetical protein
MLSLLCISCTSSKKNADSQTGTVKNDRLYVVDLDIPENDADMNLSSVFSKVETIILETNKEALVSTSFKFFAFENYLFILNQSENSPKDFLVFDRNGKFIRKIGGFGRGPGEYTRVFDFTVDTDNREIYLLCNLVINKYSMDGTYIGSIKLYEHVYCIQYAHGKLYAELRGSEYLLQEIDIKTGKQAGKFLKAAQYNKGWNPPAFSFNGIPFKYRLPESPKFVHLFMDTIVAVTQNGLVPFLALKSKHLTTNADVEETKNTDVEETKGKKLFDRIMSLLDRNKIFGILNYAETKNHVFFLYAKNRTRMQSIIYCLSTNLCRKSFLQNDLVFDINRINDKRFTNRFIFSDPNGVYECYNLQEPYSIVMLVYN